MTESGSAATIGRFAGSHWTMKIAVLAGIFLATWLWTGTARASGPPNGADLANQIQGMVNTEIRTAMAVASSAVSEVAPVAVPAVTVTMSSPEAGDPAASEPSVPSVTVDTAPAPSAPVAGLTPKQRFPSIARARSRRRAGDRPCRDSSFRWRPARERRESASPVELPRVSETRKTTSRPKQPATPKPRPRLPLAPRAPGDPGALAGGQGGGQGTSPAPLSAALAGFFLVAILLLLRRVVWSTMPMPRRVALPRGDPAEPALVASARAAHRVARGFSNDKHGRNHMTKKLCAIAAAVGALIWAAPAVASGGGGGSGALQAGLQAANTQQWAGSTAVSNQNAVNANVPVSIAGGNVYSGPSTATQNADSSAKSKASNDAETNQTQNQTQNVGGSSCAVGCGGAGGAQIGAQPPTPSRERSRRRSATKTP